MSRGYAVIVAHRRGRGGVRDGAGPASHETSRSQYVFDHGSSRTPFLFNIATMWSALEGSILLWALILAGYLLAVVYKFRKRLDDPLVAWALVTMFVVAAFFFGLMLFSANPFHSVVPPAGLRRSGTQPAAAEPHPHGVPSADALPRLRRVHGAVRLRDRRARHRTGRRGMAGRDPSVDAVRVGLPHRRDHPRRVVELRGPRDGVATGSGIPVENASFLPWLTGTAFLHSVMVQERRGMLRVWNLTLLCATFSLTILGTFLTRSGVVESVHAFSSGHGRTDPARRSSPRWSPSRSG